MKHEVVRFHSTERKTLHKKGFMMLSFSPLDLLHVTNNTVLRVMIY